MTWVLIVVGVIAVLAIIGYFLGPQGGQQPITQRDQEILQRRSMGQTPSQRRDLLDAYSLAKSAVERARDYFENGMAPEAALGRGLAESVKREARNPQESDYVARTMASVTNILMKEGVLRYVEEDQLRSTGLTAMHLRSKQDEIPRLIGVRDLNAWP